MPILYVPRKKIDKSGGEPKELYYAVAKTVQKRGYPVIEKDIAQNLAQNSSLTQGDVLSTFSQLPGEIAAQLKNGRTVNIEGVGTFYLSIKSDGVEKPEDCTPSTIKSVRICFRADEKLKGLLADCEFTNLDDLINNNPNEE